VQAYLWNENNKIWDDNQKTLEENIRLLQDLENLRGKGLDVEQNDSHQMIPSCAINKIFHGPVRITGSKNLENRLGDHSFYGQVTIIGNENFKDCSGTNRFYGPVNIIGNRNCKD
jgi:hypothetical protein